MTVEDIKKNVEAEMKKSVDSLVTEFAKIRTGRANVGMLDSLKVEYYGSLTPLSQVAALSSPDAKTLVIAPWEPSILKDIEQAIVKSSIGMAPMNDGKVIRLRVPELTEQRRKDLAKQSKNVAEEARVSIRMKRRDANEALKKMKTDKLISEDDQKRAETAVQKFTDDYIAKVDKLSVDKEKDIMTI